MQRSSRKLHTHLIRYFIQRYKVWCILILHSHTKAHVLHTHFAKLLQCSITTLISIVQTTNLIISLLQSLNRNTNTNLWKLLTQFDDTVGEEAVGRDHDTVALLIQFTHHLLQVSTNKRLTTSNIGEIHLWQFLYSFQRYLLIRLRWSLITITH